MPHHPPAPSPVRRVRHRAAVLGTSRPKSSRYFSPSSPHDKGFLTKRQSRLSLRNDRISNLGSLHQTSSDRDTCASNI